MTPETRTSANQEQNQNKREWVKPAAKVADVAVATLTGHSTPPVVDFSTCAS